MPGSDSRESQNEKRMEAAAMKGRIDNKYGSIQIDPEVIAMYAGTTAVECFGIVGMAAVSKAFKTGKPDKGHQCNDPGQCDQH